VEDRKSGDEGGRYVTGTRFFINLGKMDGLDTGNLLGLIEDVSGLSRDAIGRIELKGAYSFFEVEKNKADTILNEFKGVEYKNRQVRVEITERKTSESRKESARKEFKKRAPGNFKGGHRTEQKRRRY
jgi:ATP-dependent RNA helicase DeaD